MAQNLDIVAMLLGALHTAAWLEGLMSAARDSVAVKYPLIAFMTAVLTVVPCLYRILRRVSGSDHGRPRPNSRR